MAPPKRLLQGTYTGSSYGVDESEVLEKCLCSRETLIVFAAAERTVSYDGGMLEGCFSSPKYTITNRKIGAAKVVSLWKYL